MSNNQYTAPAFYAAATPTPPSTDSKPEPKPSLHARPSERDDPDGATVFDLINDHPGG